MLLAYDAYKASSMTATELLAEVFGKDASDLDFVWEACGRRSEGLLEAVAEVEAMTDIGEHSKHEKMFAIKQSAVMTAICEMLFLLQGEDGFDGLDIPEIEGVLDKENVDQAVKIITGGLDPNMLSMVSAHVVKGSFPKENATADIISALWIEGYITAITGPMMYEEMKESGFVKRFIDQAKKKFIILP
jgi:hypothetical protein